MIAQARRRVQQPRSVPLGAEKLFKLRLWPTVKGRPLFSHNRHYSSSDEWRPCP
jgi:hypothetical protein